MKVIAIVGCGRILPMHIVSVKHLPQAELVAVCDIVKERAEQAAAKYGISDSVICEFVKKAVNG